MCLNTIHIKRLSVVACIVSRRCEQCADRNATHKDIDTDKVNVQNKCCLGVGTYSLYLPYTQLIHYRLHF